MTLRAPAASRGAALFFALLAATLVVAALVVRARTPDLVLEVTSISPRELTLDGIEETRIEFFVRKSDPRAEISIVDGDEQRVRMLAAAVALRADREVVYRWDGRDDAGRAARPGRYRLRILLPDRDREMIWPRRITVRRANDRADRMAREDVP